ncbi:hypothetical protein FOFC_14731 [Fusarium oxysporum]|jgi:hypothetical protein|nr:hypothetical protein FOFC_14731 [Fusarium oxysporum]
MRYAIIVPWDHEPRTIDYITALALATGNHERHVDMNYTNVTLMSHAGERDEDENRQRGVICGSRHPSRSVFRTSSKEETRDQDNKHVLSRSK